MRRVLFSVVIPTYNRSNEIKRAINSVLLQTFQDFEIIVVDDGSTDATIDVVNSIDDSRIKIVSQNNSGATVARNSGILNSKGAYVSFLDSDDEWLPSMLENQYACFISDEEVGCVYSDVLIKNPSGKIINFGRNFGVSGYCYKEVLEQGFLAPTSVLSAKREILLKTGLFDITLPASQDDDICFKLAKISKVAFIPKVLAYMHSGPVNRISRNLDRVANGWWMLWNKYEFDVVNLCGGDIMAIHYYDCLLRFAFAGNKAGVVDAKNKYLIYGGNLTVFKSKIISFLTNSTGVVARILYKIIKIF